MDGYYPLLTMHAQTVPGPAPAPEAARPLVEVWIDPLKPILTLLIGSGIAYTCWLIWRDVLKPGGAREEL